MSAQEPTTRPWLADRERFTATALYVHMAMAEAVCRAPTTNSGLDLNVAAVESARLLLWCAGEASNANIIGAFRRVSRARRRRVFKEADRMLDARDASAWALDAGKSDRAFVGLEFHRAVRMACGAAALGRLTELAVEKATRNDAYRILTDPEVRARAIEIRVKPMLAKARSHAQCAAAYLAGSPQAVRSNIEESVREYQNPEAARSLLEECREVVRRATQKQAQRRGP